MAPDRPTESVAPGGALRIDKWLWFARFFKSRTLAAEFCAAGKVRIAGHVVEKAHHLVRPGDILTFPLSRQVQVIRIVALAARRGPAVVARTLYEDLAPRQAGAPMRTSGQPCRDPGAGRPTKADRRAIARLTGRT